MNQFVISKCCFCTGIIGKDVLFLKVGILQISVSWNCGFEHFLSIGLPENLQRSRTVNCGFTHGKQVAEKLKGGVKVFSNFIKCIFQLDEAIQFKVSGGNNN